jgi:hypothetical protein
MYLIMIRVFGCLALLGRGQPKDAERSFVGHGRQPVHLAAIGVPGAPDGLAVGQQALGGRSARRRARAGAGRAP